MFLMHFGLAVLWLALVNKWTAIAWSYEALSTGLWPSVDHNGEKFHPNSWRGKMAGKRLNLRGLCIRKFGDWSWYKQVLGLRGWRGETAEKNVAGCAVLVSMTCSTVMISA